MNPSYRRGVSIVLGAVAWAAVLHLAYAMFGPSRTSTVPRAAQDPSLVLSEVGPFQFTERSGRKLTDADLADKVWLASFVFTRCPTSCPKIAAVNRALQDQFRGSDLTLVSITVDPEHDSPEVLSRYARANGADPDRWLFLTGLPREETYDLVRRQFKLPVAQAGEEEKAAGSEDVLHSDKLALVDRGNQLVGFFAATDAESMKALNRRLVELVGPPSPGRDAPTWAKRLPAVNAGLNGLCALLLLAGWGLVRSGNVRGHVACMASAVAFAALFLASYLVYHYHVGSVPFRGVGPIRSVYYTILLSHTGLAAAVVPLIALTLYRAVTKQFAAHARIARLTFPIWVYVSITGVLIYLMLYQMPASATVPAV